MVRGCKKVVYRYTRRVLSRLRRVGIIARIPCFRLMRMDLIRHIDRSLSPSGLPLVPLRCMHAGDQASSHYRHVVFERFHRRSTGVTRRGVMENGCIRGNVTCGNDDSTIHQRRHLGVLSMFAVVKSASPEESDKETLSTAEIKHADNHAFRTV